MSEKSETVREVCADMYKGVEDTFGNRLPIFSPFADRIISAYEREMAAKDEAHQQWRENYHAQLAEKDAVIARLKEALKPVMECLHYDVSKATKAMVTYDEGNEEVLGEFFDKDGATVITESEINNIFKAVIDAQRIMKESENGESHN